MRAAGMLLGLCALGLAAGAAAADSAGVKEKIQDTRKDLRSVKQRLQANQKALKSQARQEQSLMGKLEGLNRELEKQRSLARAAADNLTKNQDRLLRTEAHLKKLESDEAARRESLKRSLRALYLTRGRSGPALLFSARSPSEFGARARYLAELSGAIGRKVEGLRRNISNVKDWREEYVQKQASFRRDRQEVEAVRKRVEQERLKRLGLLRSVRTKKARTAEAVKDLQRASGRLQGLLNNLQAEVERLARQSRGQAPSAPGGPTTLRRGLAWPLRGRLVSRYGRHQHPVFKTPVFNRGIEIAAPHGSPVAAVAAGTVLFAGPMEGFGELVVLDHGGGMMSVYGYNSATRVKPGQGVALGDVVAEVGENGASEQPALYFEIRRGAKALNPFTYLRSR